MEYTRNGFPRVVITGVGSITSLGDFDALGEKLKNGVSGIKKLEHDPENQMDLTKIDVHIAAYLENFDATQYMDRKEARRTAKVSHYAIAATKIMLEDAGLTEEDLSREAALS